MADSGRHVIFIRGICVIRGQYPRDSKRYAAKTTLDEWFFALPRTTKFQRRKTQNAPKCLSHTDYRLRILIAKSLQSTRQHNRYRPNKR